LAPASALRAAFAALTFSIAAHGQAAELLLAPGASVTILDAADPTGRIVMTAPADAMLDLTELLSLKENESVRSIVTRAHAQGARSMTMNPDGSISLSSAATSPARQPTPGLAGGVLIRNSGQWTLHPGAAATSSTPANPTPPVSAAPSGPKATISKPGVTREQAEREIAQCRQHAETSVTQLMAPAERVSAFNAAMYSCLRGFGYEIRG
jgi:hypothetical protein